MVDFIREQSTKRIGAMLEYWGPFSADKLSIHTAILNVYVTFAKLQSHTFTSDVYLMYMLVSAYYVGKYISQL